MVINVTRREPNSPRARRLTGTELHPLRPRLVDILIDHAPDHLPNADLLLQRYVGQEELLLKALEKKFSIAAKATSRTPSDDKPPAPPTLPVASHLSRQLSSFFFRFLRAGAAAAAPWASKGEEGAAAADCQRA